MGRRTAVLLLCCTVFAACGGGQVPSGAASSKPAAASVDKGALEAYVRHLFLWGPEIKVKVADPVPSELPGFYDVSVTGSLGEATQTETFAVSADGRKLVRGTVYDTTRSPFASDLAKLSTAAAPSAGPASAPVQLVVFSDFQCSFCKRQADVLRSQLEPAFPDTLRLVYKDFPLDSIHPWARRAAVAGRCVWAQKPEAFWTFHDQVFAHQGEITPANEDAKLKEFFTAAGVDPARVEACMAGPEAKAAVEKSFREGVELGVNSTPTMFVNGRKLVGAVQFQQLKSIVEYELKYARTHGLAAQGTAAR